MAKANFPLDRRQLLASGVAAAAVSAATDSFNVSAALAASAFPNERRIEGLNARNLGIITAHRLDATSEENSERMSQLRAEAGWLFGLLEIRGRYITRTGEIVDDRAFLLIGKEGHDSGNLLGFLRSSARQFGQDAFLYKAPDDEIAVHALKRLPDVELEGESKRRQTPNRGLGQFHQSLIGEYCHLILRRGAVSLPLGRLAINDRDWLGGRWESTGVFTPRSFFRRKSFPVLLQL